MAKTRIEYLPADDMPADAPAITLQSALAALMDSPTARDKAAAGGADLSGLVAHARATANELRILILEVAKCSGDKALLDLAETLRV
jgi:hypothetical protein